jgi:phosphopantothenate synthetase
MLKELEEIIHSLAEMGKDVALFDLAPDAKSGVDIKRQVSDNIKKLVEFTEQMQKLINECNIK